MKRVIVFILLCCVLCGVAFADSDNSINSVACGDGTVFVIMNDGKLIAWGNNSNGIIPTDHKKSNFEFKDRCLVMCNAKDVIVGEKCALAISADNGLYGWGTDGVISLLCGKAHGGIATEPVRLMDSIMCASAGFEHNAAVTTDGVLYTWGRDTNGSLGQGDMDGSISREPKTVMGKVVSVLCSGNNTLAVTEDNRLYAWGEDFGNDRPRMVAAGIVAVAKSSCGAYLLQNTSNEVLLMDYEADEDGAIHAEFSPTISSNVSRITDYGYIRDDGTLWMCNGRGSNTFIPAVENVGTVSCCDMNYRAYVEGNELKIETNEFNSFVFDESHSAAEVNLHIKPESSGIIWAIIIAAMLGAAATIVVEEPPFYKKLKEMILSKF